MDEKIAKTIVSSPLGGLEVTAENRAVTALNWVDDEPTTPVNAHPLPTQRLSSRLISRVISKTSPLTACPREMLLSGPCGQRCVKSPMALRPLMATWQRLSGSPHGRLGVRAAGTQFRSSFRVTGSSGQAAAW